jgi:hypothetical protein
MSVAKGRLQIVIVDRPAALAGRTADWRETSFVGETAALSYRVDCLNAKSSEERVVYKG